MELNDAVRRFAFGARPVHVERMPGGHINPSWRVVTAGFPNEPSYLLQQLNPAVFPDPGQVMRNLRALLVYLAQHPTEALPAQHQIRLVPTLEGADWLEERDGSVWRAFPLLPARSRDVARHAGDARSAGHAFGTFLNLLSRYDGPPIGETIAHFHDTIWYLEELDRAAVLDPAGRVQDAKAELAQCHAHRALASALAGMAQRRMLVHNDAKLANVLFGLDGERPVAVIDLDTVMAGSPLQDAGDLIRSTASRAPEDASDPRDVIADPAMVVAVLHGWFAGAGDILSADERQAAVLAGCVITLEQAVRFLTDYLRGDVYYHCTDPDQNLRRARTQLALLNSLLDHRAGLEREVGHLALNP